MNIIERDLKMFCKTEYRVTPELMESAVLAIPNIDFRLTINQPTGKFFYDPWVIKDEFKNTIWESILETLPTDIGEARIICLKPGRCYQSHADIDDRYHLNISGDSYSYLVNLETDTMYKIIKDNFWYTIDTSPKHSAINFGKEDRVQLVVRHLLKDCKFKNFVDIKISIDKLNDDDSRFLMDEQLSPWLNKKSKSKQLTNFDFTAKSISFRLDAELLDEIKSIVPSTFNLEIVQ